MNSPSSSGSLPSNTVANPRGDLKAITTRSCVSYDEPTIPTTSSPLSKEVEREPEATKDKVQTTNLGSTAHVQPLVVQVPIPEPDFLQIFQRLHFDLSFVDALLHIPKFASTFKSLISNKEKLFELANMPLNKNCSAMLLKKLPEKLRDPGKFLIPCDFPELDECLALADLGASINLMPLSIWKKLSLPELTHTRMTLELANRSVAYPVGVAEDVIVKVGKFHFPADFVVIDYDVDPRVPLILGRPFLRTARDLVDVFGEELILRDGDEKLIFHADNTSKHPQKHANESINMINFIDITCEDRFSKVLKFKKSNHPSSGSTTPLSDSPPSLTPFETNDSLLEEFADELALHDPFPPGNEYDNFDPKADLRKIEYLLNREPSTESSPMTDIEIIDPILERFTDEPAHVYSPPPGDNDDDNDDLFTTSLLILLTMEPEDSLIMGDENLSTILEKKLDEFIKSSVEDLVPIPKESKDTSDSDKECDFPFSVTFSNPFSDANEDECFDPGGDIDEIDAFLDIDVSTDIEDGYHDSEGDVIYLECLLTNDTIPNLPLEVFLDHDSRSLKGEPDNDLKSMVKFLDLEIHEKNYLKYVVEVEIDEADTTAFLFWEEFRWWRLRLVLGLAVNYVRNIRCVDLSIISFRFGLLLGQFSCHCTTVVASPPPSCSTIGEKFIAKQVDKRKKKKLEKDEHKMVGWDAFVFQQDSPSCEETHKPQGDFTSWQYAKQRLGLWDTQVCRYAAIMLSESRIKVAAEARAAATAAMPSLLAAACSKLARSKLAVACSSLHGNNDDYTKMPALISLVPP
ncbi:reverse transcriptase domain-containing protein [Tanacetum coccineum]